MYFSEGVNRIKEILLQEEIGATPTLLDNIAELLSKFCRYEEEGKKIQPSLLIGVDVQYFLQQIPSKQIYKLSKRFNESEFNRIVKSLIPLCDDGWCVFIDLNEKSEVGIFKQTDTLTISDFSDMIFKQQYAEIKGKALVYTSYRDSSSFRIRGIRGTDDVISFGFSEREKRFYFKDFIGKQFSADRRSNVEAFWQAYEDLLHRKVHGCICAFIETENKIDPIFKHGNWLKNPVRLSDGVVAFKDSDDYIELIKLKDCVDLSLDLINNDGITLFDKSGNLIAYNIFVKSKSSTENAGGARRRAAEFLVETKPKGCLAVYFQSQDGETFFKEL